MLEFKLNHVSKKGPLEANGEWATSDINGSLT